MDDVRMTTHVFKKIVWEYYRAHGRDLPWRIVGGRQVSPYKVVVSEIMLQQTQVSRVLPKYRLFVREFSSFRSLARAPLRDVLSVWQGLGYNRRGKYLKMLSEIVVAEYGGRLPHDAGALTVLPGIGANTAGAICAFAWNMPVVFIETNIRSVFLHHFFPQRGAVSDASILARVEETLDTSNPREWYYALMDYGVMLKELHPNPSRRGAGYMKQSRFAGSDREIRGAIVRALTSSPRLPDTGLVRSLGKERTRVRRILGNLEREGMIRRAAGGWRIS